MSFSILIKSIFSDCLIFHLLDIIQFTKPFVLSFLKHLLNVSDVPKTALGAGDTAVKEINNNSLSPGV